MDLYQAIVAGKEKMSVIGLGYVGLPLAIAFARVAAVVGYDISEEKIRKYHQGIDVTKEVGDKAVQETTAFLTADERYLKDCKFHIVAVPTPLKEDKTPDLRPVISASRTVGRNLTPGSIVVYESTVYPGVTEDVCLPILEEESGLEKPNTRFHCCIRIHGLSGRYRRRLPADPRRRVRFDVRH